jgi:hypothetical protein
MGQVDQVCARSFRFSMRKPVVRGANVIDNRVVAAALTPGMAPRR